MKIWKKNVIAVALLVTVCAGIYLNWLYNEDQATMGLTETLDTGKLMSEDLLVMGDEIVSEPVSTASEYFAAVRLSRQQARDEAVAVLQEAMAYDNKEMDRSTVQLEQLVADALCESQIESLVIAKGYQDCVAYIAQEGISVAVATPEGGMDSSDVAVIADIVMSQSDFSLKDIRVVEVN